MVDGTNINELQDSLRQLAVKYNFEAITYSRKDEAETINIGYPEKNCSATSCVSFAPLPELKQCRCGAVVAPFELSELCGQLKGIEVRLQRVEMSLNTTVA